MYILGINLGHDPSAVLIDSDGKVLSGIHEARITRNKKERSFPSKSISYVLNESDVDPKKITIVAYTNYDADSLRNVRDKYLGGIGQQSQSYLDILKNKISTFGLESAVLQRINHHHAHACAAYYSSSSTAEYIVTCDGFGDGESITIRKVQQGRVLEIPEVSYKLTSSLGLLYQYVTGALGFSMLAEEWKLLGLENDGDFTKVEEIFGDLIVCDEKGFQWNADKLKPWLETSEEQTSAMAIANALRLYLEYSCPKYSKNDVAAGVQKLTEDLIVSLLNKHLKDEPSTVALGGGLFLNVRLNRVISELSYVKDIFIFPAAGDGGNAIGSAFACLQSKKGLFPKTQFSNIFWGKDYVQECNEILRAKNINYLDFDNNANLVNEIDKGNVVALFSGGSEHGPRALLNRSFICSAHSKYATDKLNDALNREHFMPFGCTLLASEFEEYVKPLSMGNCMSYMLIAPEVNEDFAKKFPAVCHSTREGGWSTRPQLIYPNDGWKYELLSELKRVTGSSVVINTSFNLHGEPIVESPEDAIKTFFTANIQNSTLLLGDKLISIEQNLHLVQEGKCINSKALDTIGPRRRFETVFISLSGRKEPVDMLKLSLLAINCKVKYLELIDNKNNYVALLQGTEITRVIISWKDRLVSELKENVYICLSKADFIDKVNKIGIEELKAKYFQYSDLLIHCDLTDVELLSRKLVVESKLSLAGIIIPIKQLVIGTINNDLLATGIASVFGTRMVDKRFSGEMFIYSPFGLSSLCELVSDCEVDIESNNWLAVREKGAILVYSPAVDREGTWLEDIKYFSTFGIDGIVFNAPYFSIEQTRVLFQIAKKLNLSSIGGNIGEYLGDGDSQYGCQNINLERFINRFPGLEVR